MKALLLAAGEGTRLRPLTETVPKCLVPIAGKPLLAYWLELLHRHGIDEVVINTHYLASVVQEFARSTQSPVQIRLAHESQLLGSAGTLAATMEYFTSEDAFIIAYADNLTNVNLSALVAVHRAAGHLLTMGLFTAEDPTACGIAELAEDGAIVGFEEKPAQPRSQWANAGLYVASPDIVEYLPTFVPADIGRHLLPRLVGKMHGSPVQGYLRDIGTFESYRKAEADVVSGKTTIDKALRCVPGPRWGAQRGPE